MTAAPTASQTIGPFWHGLADPALADLTRAGGAAAWIELRGRVLDGDGAPVTDACVELWQATPRPAWGRCATDPRGELRFVLAAPDPAAPYAAVIVLARGLLQPLWTRVYFADCGDALLRSLDPPRRATLIAQRDGERWRWDIRLQGDGETVFVTV